MNISGPETEKGPGFPIGAKENEPMLAQQG